MTTQELTLKSELKYEVRVTLKFDIASLLKLSDFDVDFDLFRGIW